MHLGIDIFPLFVEWFGVHQITEHQNCDRISSKPEIYDIK